MRRRIVIVSDPGSRQNDASLETYRRALGLWRVPSQVVEVGDLTGCDLASAALVVMEDVHHLPAAAVGVLSGFVKEGGSLVLGGLVGIEAPGPMPSALAGLCGVAELRSRRSGPTYRVPRVVATADWLAPWEAGVVLFFHNPVYAPAARSRDFDMELVDGVHVVARSCLAELADEEAQCWQGFRDDDAPALVEHRPFERGGRVVYAPLPLGLVHEARCETTTAGETRPDMPQENHATLLLIKTVVCALAEAASGAVPSVALWPGAARAVFSPTGDVHEYPNLLSGNLRCEYAYIPQMKELMAKRGLAGKFTYCMAGRTFDYHPAVVQDIAGEDIIGHPYDDLFYQGGVPYDEQLRDMAATLAAIQRNLPTCSTFRLGWRNHGHTGNHDSRRAIEVLGFLYASDYQCSTDMEWNWKRYGRRMILHVNYPMKTRRPGGRRYRFWELPYCQSDIDLMQRAERGYDPDPQSWFHETGEARRAWNTYVDRAMREESLMIPLWHPWASLRTARDRAEVEATLDYMQAQEGAIFMSNSAVALWWDGRSQVAVTCPETAEGWEVCLENPLERAVEGLAVVIKGGARQGCTARDARGEALPVVQQGADAVITVDLPPRSERRLLVSVAS